MAALSGEGGALERRRRLEEERRQRIFNPKMRKCGVDTAALDEQIRMKREREELEKARERAYEEEQARANRQLALLEQQQAEMRREEALALERFRKEQQQYSTRKEFDLNDPDYLKKDRPAREGDVPPLGPSSLQVFVGEDLRASERRKLQAEQMRKWCEEQQAIKDYKSRQEAEAERLYELRQMELNQRRGEMEDAQSRTRAAILAADRAYNERKAEEMRRQERQRRVDEMNENLEEIHNNLNSDLLTENPAVARNSALGGHRLRTTEYKGMTPAEAQAFREAQRRQMEENERKRRQEEEEEQRWQMQAEANRRAAVRNEELQRQAQKNMNRKVLQDNSMIADEQKQKKDYLDRRVYTNEPSQSFWDQFNTTTR